ALVQEVDGMEDVVESAAEGAANDDRMLCINDEMKLACISRQSPVSAGLVGSHHRTVAASVRCSQLSNSFTHFIRSVVSWSGSWMTGTPWKPPRCFAS